MSSSEDRRFIIQTFQDYLEGKQPNDSAANTGNRQRDTYEGKPNPFPFYTNEGEKNRHEHRHRVQEKVFWSAYIAVAVLTLGAATAAACYAGGAYTQAKRQADYAERAAPRAWLFVTLDAGPRPPDPWFEDRIKDKIVIIAVNLHNFGQLPGTVTSFVATANIAKSRESDLTLPEQFENGMSFESTPHAADVKYVGKTISSGESLFDLSKNKPSMSKGIVTAYIDDIWLGFKGLDKIENRQFFEKTMRINIVVGYKDPFGTDRKTAYSAICMGGDFIQEVSNAKYNYQK